MLFGTILSSDPKLSLSFSIILVCYERQRGTNPRAVRHPPGLTPKFLAEISPHRPEKGHRSVSLEPCLGVEFGLDALELGVSMDRGMELWLRITVGFLKCLLKCDF